MEKKILKMLADAAKKTAQAAGNSASFFGLHQPKEPKVMQKNISAK